jgi:hypothetical protein
MAFNILIPSITGVLNGYTKKEGGMSSVEKRTILSISAVVGGARTISKMYPLTGQLGVNPVYGIAALFLGIPLAVCSSYCMGHHFGKALRHTDEIHSAMRK